MYNLQSALQNTKISELNENVLSQAEKSSVRVNAYSYIFRMSYEVCINQFHPSKQVKDISLIKMHCNKQHKFFTHFAISFYRVL